jgi:hypothetical protein
VRLVAATSALVEVGRAAHCPKGPKERLSLASHILNTNAGHFDPSRFKDEFVMGLRAPGSSVRRPQDPEQETNRGRARQGGQGCSLMDFCTRGLTCLAALLCLLPAHARLLGDLACRLLGALASVLPGHAVLLWVIKGRTPQ